MLNRNLAEAHPGSLALEEIVAKDLQSTPISGSDARVLARSPVDSGAPGWYWRRAGALLFGYGALFLVLLSGHVPCATATLTHHPCPGCGTTRAARALFLHFDVAQAIRYNPFGPLVIASLFVLAAESVLLMLRRGKVGNLGIGGASRWALWGLMAAVFLQIVVWIARFFGFFGGPVPVE